MKSFYLFVALLISSFIHAQVATVSNHSPAHGEIIEIIYTPDSTSTFQLTDEVYVSYQLFVDDYSIRYETEKLKRIGQKFVLELEVESGASLYSISFRNGDKSDRSNRLELKPVDGNGKFYRNSYWNELFYNLEAHKDELDLYPENHSLYVQRWRRLNYLNKDSARTIILAEMQDLKQIQKKNETTLFAFCIGNAILGDFDQARTFLLDLIRQHPESHLLVQGQYMYEYWLYSHSVTDSIYEDAILSFARKYPENEIAKQKIRSFSRLKESETIKEIAKIWMNKDPEDAYMPYYYAQAIDDAQAKIYYLNKALNILFDQKLSVKNYYDWSNWIYRLLPQIIEELNKSGAYVHALSLIEMFETHSDKENAALYRMKGVSTQLLNNHEEAFKWYSISADLGDKVSYDSAKSVFEQMNLDKVDFEEYSNRFLSELFYAEEVKEAPQYEVEDMYGNTYTSEDLKGKVIVLNFWFIGCAPCIREMPGLNEMVKEYEGKEVVFIAFANDSKESLEKFLKKRAFNYHVIPSARTVAQSYNVNSYPTHVIIDKKGNVRATLTGGSVDRHKDLIPYINRVLRF